MWYVCKHGLYKTQEWEEWVDEEPIPVVCRIFCRTSSRNIVNLWCMYWDIMCGFEIIFELWSGVDFFWRGISTQKHADE